MITWTDIGNIVALFLIALCLYRLVQWSAAGLDRFVAINRQHHAKADQEQAKAIQPKAIPGVVHQAIIVSGDEWELIDIKPAPIQTQAGEILAADEINLLAACGRLVELSKTFEQQGDAGTRIAPAAFADGKIGVKWFDVTEYMQSQGWIVKVDRVESICKPPTSNLAALALAIAIKALPRRVK